LAFPASQILQFKKPEKWQNLPSISFAYMKWAPSRSIPAFSTPTVWTPEFEVPVMTHEASQLSGAH